MKNVLLKFMALFHLLNLFTSCTTTGPGLFKKRSPHEQYLQKLKNSGLDNTSLGRAWINQSEVSLENALSISLPYEEIGYFAAERIQATALQFEAKQGQKLTITLNQKPNVDFQIYAELWRKKDNDKLKLLAYADTNDTGFNYEIDDEGSYVLRLQPELLVSGEYTLSIAVGPSLAFPVKGKGRNSIQSLYGVDRDAGARKHEGVDIFASRNTPAVAAAPGVVTRVTVNNLGGKVVFLRPQNRDYALYYAHLDSQLVRDGDVVDTGDTLGLIGNTGNARFTSPHLHFGVYARGGAVDPLPYIDPKVYKPSKAVAPVDRLSKSSRARIRSASVLTSLNNKSNPTARLLLNTLFRIDAVTGSLYKITLPDGTTGFIESKHSMTAEVPIQQITTPDRMPLYDKPEISAARKMILPPGETVDVLGVFNDFYYVTNNNQYGWLEKF